jgi:hypothetical protein
MMAAQLIAPPPGDGHEVAQAQQASAGKTQGSKRLLDEHRYHNGAPEAAQSKEGDRARSQRLPHQRYRHKGCGEPDSSPEQPDDGPARRQVVGARHPPAQHKAVHGNEGSINAEGRAGCRCKGQQARFEGGGEKGRDDQCSHPASGWAAAVKGVSCLIPGAFPGEELHGETRQEENEHHSRGHPERIDDTDGNGNGRAQAEKQQGRRVF